MRVAVAAEVIEPQLVAHNEKNVFARHGAAKPSMRPSRPRGARHLRKTVVWGRHEEILHHEARCTATPRRTSVPRKHTGTTMITLPASPPARATPCRARSRAGRASAAAVPRL